MASEDVGDAMGKYEMAFTKDESNIEATAKAIADTYFKLIVPLVEKQRRFHKPLAANSRCVDRGTAVVDALAHKTVGQTQR